MNVNIIIAILILIIFIISYLSTQYGVKIALMSKRKSSEQMIDELFSNFEIDYKSYKNLDIEEVTIKSEDKLQLRGFYHNIYPQSKKVIIINHGYTANHYVAYQFIDIFIEEGYNVLLIDMRSHGQSEGTIASYGYHESKDIGCWVDYVKERIGEDAYIGLHGQSMGASTVLIYAGNNENKVRFVIEDCGFSNAKEAMKFQFKQGKIPFYPIYELIRLSIRRNFGFDLNNISPKEDILKSNIPVLFIHGDDDEIVPSYMAREMYESKGGKKDMLYIAYGAKHMKSCVSNREMYKDNIKRFLENL
ncbi:MAG: alpha/beta hydrolase [Romboutsia sp.]